MDRLSANARAFSVAALLGAAPEESLQQQQQQQQQQQEVLPANVELLNAELWNEFSRIGTEMIITKAGRRMFPSVKIRIGGLDDHVRYLLYVDMDPVDDRRYKYIYHR